jgi:hypothetical protein
MEIRSTAACVVALLLGIHAARGAEEAAQESRNAEAKSAALLDEVTVTGTRIKQREDYVSPNPIQTIASAS